MVNPPANCPRGSKDKTKEWQMEMLMEKLRTKAGQFKSFYDSAKALRMTLLEKRYPIDSVEKIQLQKCLDTLQQNIKVTTHQAMVERLESVSRQLGLKFVTGPSGQGLFISSDMFYLEVILEPNGGVKDVKIHHEGRGEQSCEELVECLSKRDFSDFTAQLEGLSSIYQLNAEKKVKCKAFAALTSLEADLSTLGSLQQCIKDPNVMVHETPIGIVEKRRGGHPMKLTYFVSPYDLLDPVTRKSKPLTLEGLNVGNSVSVCMESSTAHKLQTSSIVTVGRNPDGTSWPVYAPLGATNSITVAGSFVLTLNKPMPVCISLVNSIQEITMISCADVSSPHPLLSLIVQHASGGLLDSANSASLYVNVADQQHCYLMTESRNLDGVIVASIPFTHPSHVPQIIALLRQQALFNCVISSCVRPHVKPEVEKIMLEVTPLSWQHLSISLEHPLEESMATVELDLSNISNVTCKVYTSSIDNGSMNNSDYATKVFQRCLSIPVTMRSLIKMWHAQNLRMCSSTFNGGGMGGTGGSGGGGGNLPTHPKTEFDTDIQMKLEPSSLGGLVGRQDNFVNDQSLPDATFEHFSSPMDTDLSNVPVDFPDFSEALGKVASLGALSESKSGKRKKRKSGDSWRSPKRKHLDDSPAESSSSDSTPLGTPTSRDASDLTSHTPTSSSGLELTSQNTLESSGVEEKSASEPENDEPPILEIEEDEEEEEISKPPKKQKKREERKSSDLIFELDKSIVPPSVSITPITTAITSPSYSALSGMGLDRRPGIEIIPITAVTPATLPNSLTITPISSKSSEDRGKSERRSNKSSKSDDKSKLDKKRKRKREDSPMGPPEKVPHKSDPLTKPVSVSIKPTEGSPSPSPQPSSPASTLRKYSTSPTPHNSPLTMVGGKSSPSSSSSKSSKSSQQSPKHSPAYTSSPKSNLTSSPKHGTSSPKHQSSSGKPSMSTLKSAVNSPSKSEGKVKSKDSREKDKKIISSGHSGLPKIKSSSVKLRHLDLTNLDVPQSLQSGGSTPPSSGDGGKSSSSQIRNRKSSLSAVIDKLKSAQHCPEETVSKDKKDNKERSSSDRKLDSKNISKPGENKPSEYMVKPSSDGMKITINKTRTKESSKLKSSGSGSPKTHSGLKPGVNCSLSNKKQIISQKTSALPSNKSSSSSSSSSGSSSSTSSGKSISKSSSFISQKSLKPTGSPKSDPNRIRDKPRMPKPSDKMLFSSSKSDSKKLSPAAHRDETENSLKALQTAGIITSPLVAEGIVKQLDTKFQIPKLSARSNNNNQSEDKKVDRTDTRGSDSPKIIDLANKQDLKYLTNPKNLEDLRVSSGESKIKTSTLTVGNVSPKLCYSKLPSGLDLSDSPNISIIPVQSLSREKEEKDPKSFQNMGSSHGIEDVLTSFKMELPISALSLSSCDPYTEKVEVPRQETSVEEAAELLLDFSASAPKPDKFMKVTERVITASLRKNTPPPAFPGSPAVSVHIVKSPVPSEHTSLITSPHSSSPSCITDDELMDEAVVGMGK